MQNQSLVNRAAVISCLIRSHGFIFNIRYCSGIFFRINFNVVG